MTVEGIRFELADIAGGLPALAAAVDAAARALSAAEDRVEDVDPSHYRGRVCGALAGALEAVGIAKREHTRAVAALAKAKRRRTELLALLRTAACTDSGRTADVQRRAEAG